jgi:hypothetical protein
MTLQEKHLVRLFGTKVLRKICRHKWEEVIGGCKKLLNEKFHYLYSSPNIQVIKSSSMGWLEHVACVWVQKHRVAPHRLDCMRFVCYMYQISKYPVKVNHTYVHNEAVILAVTFYFWIRISFHCHNGLQYQGQSQRCCPTVIWQVKMRLSVCILYAPPPYRQRCWTFCCAHEVHEFTVLFSVELEAKSRDRSQSRSAVRAG